MTLTAAAQESDTLSLSDSARIEKQRKKKIYSHARRATYMSVFLPGLGQAYNRRYWKIPIVYAGLGGFAYLYANNNVEYTKYRDAMIAIKDDDPNTVNTTPYDYEQLKTLKDQYKKNRDLATIGFFAVYVLNIIDANVDGHLITFDVSDDLGLQVDPWFDPVWGPRPGKNWGSAGLTLKFNFK